jgi:hypothetical protein
LRNAILQVVIGTGTTSRTDASLLEVAAGLAATASLLGTPAPPPATKRSWVRLCSTDDFDAWLISWPPGDAVEFHDHGESAGAFVVLHGALVEVEPGGMAGAQCRRPLPSGARRAVPRGAVHDVVNESSASALSVHVYAPPLHAMTFYDPHDLAPLRTVTVGPEPPAVAPDSFVWTNAS